MKTLTFKNGFKVCFIPVKNVKVVQFTLMVKSGNAYETRKTLGFSHFLEHLLVEASQKYPGKKILHEMDSKGIEYNASTQDIMVDYYTYGSSAHWKFMLDSLLEIIIDAKFLKSTFEREKKAIIEELKINLDDPLLVLEEDFNKVLYPKTVLRYNTNTTLLYTKKVTLPEIKRFYKQKYNPSNTTLLIVGNFPETKIIKELQKINKIKKNEIKQPILTGVKLPVIHYAPNKKVNKTYCLMAFKGNYRYLSKEYFIGVFIKTLLTNGFMGILDRKLRLEKNLIYSIGSSFDMPFYHSMYILEFDTSNHQFKECVDLIFKELYKLKTKLITTTDYKMVREKIKTKRDKLHNQHNVPQISSFYQKQLIRGVPLKTKRYKYQQLLKITKKDVQNFAKKYFKINNMAIVYTGKQKIKLPQKI